ncbi:MAG TPA: hypothetical protein VEJ42_05305 [Streptosporangiaceae bacterium]|nr:hypothetical protein [Streptosporangiaceae bacterium]
MTTAHRCYAPVQGRQLFCRQAGPPDGTCFAPRMNTGRSFVIFSGVAATKITVGTMAAASTDAAAGTLARSLALELALA